MLGQVLRFASVGAAATAEHFAVAVAAVRLQGTEPRPSNVVGFVIAFAVSFLARWRVIFAVARAPFARVFPAHFAVCLGACALNAAACHLLLRHTALRYDLALALALAAVAVCTCAAGRWRGFRPARSGA